MTVEFNTMSQLTLECGAAALVSQVLLVLLSQNGEQFI